MPEWCPKHRRWMEPRTVWYECSDDGLIPEGAYDVYVCPECEAETSVKPKPAPASRPEIKCRDREEVLQELIKDFQSQLSRKGTVTVENPYEGEEQEMSIDDAISYHSAIGSSKTVVEALKIVKRRRW